MRYGRAALARWVLFCDFHFMRSIYGLVLVLGCLSASAAEIRFDFAGVPVGKTPTNFHAVVAGAGVPGDWRVEMDEVPPTLEPLSSQAPSVARRAVLGQFARDTTDERFPMLVFDGETFTDFTLSTKFKIVSGVTEQMAGVAFRVQDEKNFYVIRANSLNRNVRFYKVVDGVRSVPIGPEVNVGEGTWHELKITCTGNEIRAWLDGREPFPALQDTTFRFGKIAYWTKSDSISYFVDTVITYKPKVPLAQTIVQDMMKKYPRIVDLKVYRMDEEKKEMRVVASKEFGDVGQPGGKYELATLEKGQIYYAKAKDHVEMVMPLRDRNGETIAAVRVHLNTFTGQTEQNALIRAMPIVKEMQASVQTKEELFD